MPIPPFGWTIMLPGAYSGLPPALLAVNSNADYEKLCALDILGLADSATGDQSAVDDEFKEQLVHSPERHYETGLPWKGNCPPLPNNREDTRRGLDGGRACFWLVCLILPFCPATIM